MSTCTAARTAIETRNFIGWKGIPMECGAAQLFENLPSDLAARPRRRLGEAQISATFVLLKIPGYYQPTASFRDEKLVLFDGANPEMPGEFKSLRADLGEPAIRLDWYRGSLLMEKGEWVYPTRGITLFVDPDDPEHLMHVAVYYATTAETYVKTLHPNLQKRPLPFKR